MAFRHQGGSMRLEGILHDVRKPQPWHSQLMLQTLLSASTRAQHLLVGPSLELEAIGAMPHRAHESILEP